MGYYGKNGLEIYGDSGNIAETDYCPCGLWIITGSVSTTDKNVIMRSNGGRLWYGERTPFDTYWSCAGLSYNGSIWVGCGNFTDGNTTGCIITSSDDVNWTIQTTPAIYSRDIAWNGSMWVVVGDGIMTSTNAVDWTYIEVENSFKHIAWNGFLWVAAGDSKNATSPDGINWTIRDSPISAGGLAYGGGLWVQAGGSSVATSPDAVNWIIRPIPGFANYAMAVVWSGSLWVVTGAGHAQLATSPDGVNWTATPAFPVGYVYKLGWDGDRFVGSGISVIYSSADGINWTLSQVGMGGHYFHAMASKTAPALYPPIG